MQPPKIDDSTREERLAYVLEYDVGKQGYGRGINNSQPFYPFLCAVTPAVRKNVYFCPWLRLILFCDYKGNHKG